MNEAYHRENASTPATILIVDDDPTNVEVLECVLDSVGYGYLEAANGREALEVLARNTPDLILLDLMMPVMDGFEVCRRVKTSAQWQDIPIIIVSALSEDEDRQRATDCGADDFLNKPVDFSVLLDHVDKYLCARQAMPEPQQSDSLYRRLIDASPDAFLVHRDGKIVFLNASGARLLGVVNPERLLGSSLLAVTHPSDHDMLSAYMRQVQRDDMAVPLLKTQFVRLDGIPIEVEIASTPFVYENQPAALMVIRHVAEQQPNRRLSGLPPQHRVP